MEHYFIKILRHGDTVLSVQEQTIVVRRANGEVDIINFFTNEQGVIRFDEKIKITITYGEGNIETKSFLDIDEVDGTNQTEVAPSVEEGQQKNTEKKKKLPSKIKKNKSKSEVIRGTF